jgi:hypothetical protein
MQVWKEGGKNAQEKTGIFMEHSRNLRKLPHVNWYIINEKQILDPGMQKQ